jgi:hypothetical protein
MQPNQNPEQIARDAIALVQQKTGFYPGDSAREQAQQELVRLLDSAVEAVERNERAINYAVKRSAALRQSILKKAFTGQLVTPSPRRRTRVRPPRSFARRSTGRRGSKGPASAHR